MVPSLAEIARSVDDLLHTAAFPDDPPTLYRPSTRPVRRLGLALAADAGLVSRMRAEKWDALFLHRPWGAESLGFPTDLGILCSHAAFDARLALGPNPYLASALEMGSVQPFGEHRGRLVGMIGNAPPAGAAAWCTRLVAEFGGLEEVHPAPDGEDDAQSGSRLPPPSGPVIHRVAVVGAMTDALVREAADKGAGLYVTGQMRAPARRAITETGMVAVAIGHRRSEEHGLAVLAALLARGFPGLELYPPRALPAASRALHPVNSVPHASTDPEATDR